MIKIIKKHKYILTIIITLIIVLLSIIRHNCLKENNKRYSVQEKEIIINKEPITKEEQEAQKKIIKIDIKGQVINPGVYELEENSRVIDAINKAGGLTEIANTSLINLSKKLEDSMVIIIYSNEEVENSNVKQIETVFKIIEKECNCPVIENDSCINTEITKEESNEENTNTENKLVNINTSSKEELMTVSGIGESKADSIIEYRKTNKFNSIEDIMNVSGIGEKLFEQIKTHITI